MNFVSPSLFCFYHNKITLSAQLSLTVLQDQFTMKDLYFLHYLDLELCVVGQLCVWDCCARGVAQEL